MMFLTLVRIETNKEIAVMIPRTKTAAVVLWKVEYSWSLQASATRPGMLMIGASANDLGRCNVVVESRTAESS